MPLNIAPRQIAVHRLAMPVRKVFLPLVGSDGDGAAIRAAFEIARLEVAHVEGVFLRFDQRYGHFRLPGRLSRDVFDELTTMVAQSEDKEAHARDLFHAGAAAIHASMTDDQVPGRRPSARWRGSRPADRVLRDAPLSDLTVVGKAAAEDRRAAALRGAVLTMSGRPMLVVPRSASQITGRGVAIAWNASSSSARALTSALPFLKHAPQTWVLTAKTSKTRSSEADQLVAYLALHDIKAKAVVLDPTGQAVGAALVEHAQTVGASLFVMGGQARSRFEDKLFGGVTSYVFEHASLPVLIAQ